MDRRPRESVGRVTVCSTVMVLIVGGVLSANSLVKMGSIRRQTLLNRDCLLDRCLPGACCSPIGMPQVLSD